MAADRHLLFGLLALQTGLIQQAELVAAFHAWTCDKSRSLAEHLMELGHLDSAHRPLLEGLAAAHSTGTAATCRRAWPPSPPAGPLARNWPGWPEDRQRDASFARRPVGLARNLFVARRF